MPVIATALVFAEASVTKVMPAIELAVAVEPANVAKLIVVSSEATLTVIELVPPVPLACTA